MNLKEFINSDRKEAEFVRFGIVGGICTVLQYSIYILFVNLVHVPPVVSTMISYAISFCANFALSSLFTFKTKANAMKGVAFALSHLVNMGMQVGFVAIFKGIVGKNLALLPALCICVPLNYFMVRFAFTSKIFGGRKPLHSDAAGLHNGLKEVNKG